MMTRLLPNIYLFITNIFPNRRAQENQGMLTKLDLEKTLLRRELVRRIGR